MTSTLKKALTMQWLNVPGVLSYSWTKLRDFYYNPSDSRKRFWVREKNNDSIPHYYLESINDINPEKIRDIGIKAILCDFDNTLAIPYSSDIHPKISQRLEDLRYAVSGEFYVVSNTLGTRFYENEAIEIERKTGLRVLRHFWKKPWGYEHVCQDLKITPEEIMMIGDRRYTDILFGNYLSALTVLVKPFTEQGDVAGVSSIRRKEIIELEELIGRSIRAPRHKKYSRALVNNDIMLTLDWKRTW